jgi:hypothetical protein
MWMFLFALANNCRILCSVVHTHEHRFNQLLSHIIESTIWGSVLLGNVFNTQKCTVQHYEPHKSIHLLLSVLYALFPDGITGIMLGLVLLIVFPLHLQPRIPLQWQDHEHVVSWIAVSHFILMASVLENNLWQLNKSLLFIRSSVTYTRLLAHSVTCNNVARACCSLHCLGLQSIPLFTSDFSSAADECDVLPFLVFPAHCYGTAMMSTYNITFLSLQDTGAKILGHFSITPK